MVIYKNGWNVNIAALPQIPNDVKYQYDGLNIIPHIDKNGTQKCATAISTFLRHPSNGLYQYKFDAIHTAYIG